MNLLVNAYATVVVLPELNFRGEVLGQRDVSNPELAEHLQGFIGYVLQLDGEEMTQAKYYTPLDVLHGVILGLRHLLAIELQHIANEAL